LNLLAIDTTTDTIVLALLNGERRDYFIGEAGCKKHNASLLTLIDAFLNRNALKISDVDVFGVNVGPGSFTGIRIGVATVNAFSKALNKRLVEVTSLEQLKDKSDKLALLSCGHGNFYAGLFEGESVRYFSLSEEELKNYAVKKEYLNSAVPERLLEKCIEKAQGNAYVKQARPFYIKESSAKIPL